MSAFRSGPESQPTSDGINGHMMLDWGIPLIVAVLCCLFPQDTNGHQTSPLSPAAHKLLMARMPFSLSISYVVLDDAVASSILHTVYKVTKVTVYPWVTPNL
jgi:hypothetical protein